eukprot:TRINITY_DN28767_c0_g1_i1.p1 TRINITY_DN28767_c0_g1~~TRINITY_DN28767_c0_g1_i1.p1  ORF type:complete len:124 (+),score=24.97 TRINITY_DN28767_c0_g1_i1:775-1146(+)
MNESHDVDHNNQQGTSSDEVSSTSNKGTSSYSIPNSSVEPIQTESPDSLQIEAPSQLTGSIQIDAIQIKGSTRLTGSIPLHSIDTLNNSVEGNSEHGSTGLPGELFIELPIEQQKKTREGKQK